MYKTTYPARLHALLAKDKPYGVVFRRGPSNQVCSFLWNRRKDTFELGQWLKGRIYERRADLSPDGKFLIYFAMNGKWDSETGGSWTAISKAPWLKALELYAKGDCWEGGGLFLSNNRFWLNDRCFTPTKISSQYSQVTRDDNYIPEGEFGAECTGVYYRRLIRDNWSLVSKKGNQCDSQTVFEKKLPKGWILRKIAHEQVFSPKGKGCYWDEHKLINHKSETTLNLFEWEWAELDGVSLVWASKGCMYRASIINHKKIGESKLLYDFNPFKFEEIQAPY